MDRKPDIDLKLFVDSAHGTGLDRISVFGYVLMFNDAPLLFKTKKQREVSLSTTESEFVALAVGVSHENGCSIY